VARRVAVIVALLSTGPFARAAEAQDVFYRSWRWVKETSAARAAGLGGAMTAVPDDASGAESNPAALTTLVKSELLGNVLNRRDGTTAEGDALRARTGMGFLGLGGRLSAHWAVGVYAVEPQAVRLESSTSLMREGSTGTGRVEGTLTEAAASAAWRPVSRLHVGVRLAATRLTLDGSYRLQPASGSSLLEVSTEGDATSLTAGIGILYEASPRVWLGLARLGGARFEIPRTARLNGLPEQALDGDGPSVVRQPSVVSGGLALLAGTRVLLTGQLDYVRYGEIQTPFASLAPGGTVPRFAVFAWEPRVGIELSLPFSAMSIQLRAGLSGRSAAGAERRDSAAAPVPTVPPLPSPPPAPIPTRTALQEITALATGSDRRLSRHGEGPAAGPRGALRRRGNVRAGRDGNSVLTPDAWSSRGGSLDRTFPDPLRR
jgi:hypothetical protein